MYELTEKFGSALLLIFGLLIFTKHAQKIFMIFRGKTEQSGGHKHLDQLIRKNESLFRGSSPKPDFKATNGQKSKKSWQTLLNQEAQKYQNSIELESIDFFIKLYKEFEWGDGKHLKAFEKKINTKSPIPFTKKQIKTFIDFYLNSGLQYPYSKSDRFIKPHCLHESITKVAFLYQLQVLLQKKNFSTYSTILRTDSRQLENALLHFFLVLQKRDFHKALDDIFHQKKKVSEVVRNFSLNGIYQDLLNKPHSDFEFLWRRLLNIWSTLSPISISLKSTTTEFLKFLGCSKNSSQDQIKKQYKTEIKKRHPDLFSSYSLPKQYETIITQNFQIIQDLYEKVIKELKN